MDTNDQFTEANAGQPRSAEHLGLNVPGYRPTQPQWAIDAVTQLKHAEERAHRLLDDLVLKGEDVDQRAVAVARTTLQQAFMWAARGVFQPTRILLPEDNQGQMNFSGEPDPQRA